MLYTRLISLHNLIKKNSWAGFESMHGQIAVCMHRDAGWSYWSRHQGTAAISGCRALPFHSRIYYKLKKISPVQLATGKCNVRRMWLSRNLNVCWISWFESHDYWDLLSDIFECLRTCTWLNVQYSRSLCDHRAFFACARLSATRQTVLKQRAVQIYDGLHFSLHLIYVRCVPLLNMTCACVAFVFRSNKSIINQMGIHSIVYSVAS